VLTRADLLRKLLKDRAETGETVRDRKVVLDVFRRVDDCDRRRVAGFNRFQKVNDLFVYVTSLHATPHDARSP
jgi:hypothetical protein